MTKLLQTIFCTQLKNFFTTIKSEIYPVKYCFLVPWCNKAISRAMYDLNC